MDGEGEYDGGSGESGWERWRAPCVDPAAARRTAGARWTRQDGDRGRGSILAFASVLLVPCPLETLSLSLSLSLHMLQMLAVHCNGAGASLSRGETRPDLLGSEAFDKLASRASHQPPKVNYRPLIQNGEIPLTVHVRMYLPGNFTTLKQGSMVHFRWLVEALGYLLRDFRIFLKEKPLDERSPSTSASISLHLYYYRHGLCRFLTPPLATRR